MSTKHRGTRKVVPTPGGGWVVREPSGRITDKSRPQVVDGEKSYTTTKPPSSPAPWGPEGPAGAAKPQTTGKKD